MSTEIDYAALSVVVMRARHDVLSPSATARAVIAALREQGLVVVPKRNVEIALDVLDDYVGNWCPPTTEDDPIEAHGWCDTIALFRALAAPDDGVAT